MKDYLLIFAELSKKVTYKQMNIILEALMESDTFDINDLTDESLKQFKSTIQDDYDMIVK